MKTSKFRPIHFTIQIWTDFHENEAKKKKNDIDVAQPIIIWSEILMFSLVFSKFLAMRNIKLHSVGKTLQNLKNIFSTISIKAFL